MQKMVGTVIKNDVKWQLEIESDRALNVMVISPPKSTKKQQLFTNTSELQ